MLEKSHKNQILNHLSSLKLKNGENIVLHSNISTFGIASKELPHYILKSIINIIGKKGTLIMPMYNLNLSKKIVYKNDKLYNIRAISSLYKTFFKTKKKIISKSYIHRHFGIGKRALILKKTNPEISLGKGSDFEKFYKNNFTLLLLGCKPSEGATYLHHLESLKKVPYRKKVILKRKIFLKKKRIIGIKYFARKNFEFIENFDSVFNKKIIKDKTLRCKNKYAFSYKIKFRDLHKAGIKLLDKDKYAFVKKR